jgi:hypothetical protein
MAMRLVLPVAAAALALAAVSGCSSDRAAQSSSATQVRPAQAASGQCDDLVRQVESRMPTAAVYRVPGARANLEEARQLCNSGQPQEGEAMLRQILGVMNQEP